VLDDEALMRLLRTTLGERARLDSSLLAPASPRQTLVRVLTNIRGVYMRRSDDAKALLAQTRIVELTPNDAQARLDRATLAEKLGAVTMALDDAQRARSLVSEDDRGLAQLDAHIARLQAAQQRMN
jgi:regulator of sirC expression with transglutaminase-like and TPR domain